MNPFFLHENFGLDKNLSTEIRHGFFSNYMRSILQERSLITEIGDDDQYASNEYWKNQYLIVHDDILEAVDIKLKEFSSGFNELIYRVEEWMHIRILIEQTNRVFFYPFRVEDSQVIQEKLDVSNDPEEIGLYIFDLLASERMNYCQKCATVCTSNFKLS